MSVRWTTERLSVSPRVGMSANFLASVLSRTPTLSDLPTSASACTHRPGSSRKQPIIHKVFIRNCLHPLPVPAIFQYSALSKWWKVRVFRMRDEYYDDTGSSRLHNVYACLKYTMYIVNLAIFICGTVLLGLGVWIKLGSSSFVKILGSYSEHFVDVVFLCIIVGCVMCVLGFIGCFGAHRENRFLLFIFLILMLMFFVTAISATILVLDFGNLLNGILKDIGLKSLKKIYYAHENTGVVTESWNAVMSKLLCCGFFGYSDFESSIFSNKTGLKYPRNCCQNPYLNQCDGTNTSSKIIYMQGCFPMILENVKKNSRSLGITGGIVTGLVLSSMIVSLVLFVKLG